MNALGKDVLCSKLRVIIDKIFMSNNVLPIPLEWKKDYFESILCEEDINNDILVADATVQSKNTHMQGEAKTNLVTEENRETKNKEVRLSKRLKRNPANRNKIFLWMRD
jgi:predicted Zn-dependent protease